MLRETMFDEFISPSAGIEVALLNSAPKVRNVKALAIKGDSEHVTQPRRGAIGVTLAIAPLRGSTNSATISQGCAPGFNNALLRS